MTVYTYNHNSGGWGKRIISLRPTWATQWDLSYKSKNSLPVLVWIHTEINRMNWTWWLILGGWDKRISMGLRPDWGYPMSSRLSWTTEKTVSKKSGQRWGEGNMVRNHTPLGLLFLLKVNFFFRLLIIGKETITFQGNFGGAACLLFQNILHAILSVNKWCVYLCTDSDIIKE